MMRKTQLIALGTLALALGTSRSAFAVSALDAYSLSGILQSESVKPVLKNRMIEKISVNSEENGKVSTHQISLTLSQFSMKDDAVVNQTCLVHVTVEDIMNLEGTERVVQATEAGCK
jgi:hypothetical protein